MVDCGNKKNFYIRFTVDFDKNQCITKIFDKENKEDRSAFNWVRDMIWPIPKEGDIISLISSNNDTIIEIRLGAVVEYMR